MGSSGSSRCARAASVRPTSQEPRSDAALATFKSRLARSTRELRAQLVRAPGDLGGLRRVGCASSHSLPLVQRLALARAGRGELVRREQRRERAARCGDRVQCAADREGRERLDDAVEHLAHLVAALFRHALVGDARAARRVARQLDPAPQRGVQVVAREQRRGALRERLTAAARGDQLRRVVDQTRRLGAALGARCVVALELRAVRARVGVRADEGRRREPRGDALRVVGQRLAGRARGVERPPLGRQGAALAGAGAQRERRGATPDGGASRAPIAAACLHGPAGCS